MNSNPGRRKQTPKKRKTKMYEKEEEENMMKLNTLDDACKVCITSGVWCGSPSLVFGKKVYTRTCGSYK